VRFSVGAATHHISKIPATLGKQWEWRLSSQFQILTRSIFWLFFCFSSDDIDIDIDPTILDRDLGKMVGNN
jgi:hypothetical protein